MRNKEEHQYWVYMLTNASKRVLYTGVTNNLPRRLLEHSSGAAGGFTAKYRTHMLVFAQATDNVLSAIAREKPIKGWVRSKKNELVESINPEWNDLGIEWGLIPKI